MSAPFRPPGGAQKGFVCQPRGPGGRKNGGLLSLRQAASSSGSKPTQGQTPTPTQGAALEGYLYVYSNAVDFLQLNINGSQITGSEEETANWYPNQLQSVTCSINGEMNGNNITLTMQGSYCGRTLTGTFDGNNITLAILQTNGSIFNAVYNKATTDDYNNAVNSFEGNIAAATATTVQQQSISDSNNQLSGDINALQGDIGHLTEDRQILSDMSAYQSDMATLQKDYNQEKSDLPQGCTQVNLDVAHIDGVDIAHIQGVDDADYSNNQSGTNNRIKITQSDMQTLQSNWQNAQSIGNSSFTQADIDKAMSDAQSQINSTQAVLRKTQSQVNDFDAQASQIDKKAQTFVNNNGC